jgi:hypothetical protein
MLQDNIGATYRNINAQFLENGFILGVSHAGYGAGDVKLVLGHLAGHQIILVVTSDRNKHISPSGSYFGQSSRLTAITADANATQLIIYDFTEARILFHDNDFMALI